MSYYVLTLASNLGNILSTETISPASLYARRNYGFRFFETIAEDDDADLIRLYDNLPTAPSVDEDSIAMVLELDESLVKHVVDGLENGLWTAETIRIDPVKCSFVFYSDEDKNAAFNGVQRSIEAKFSGKYRAKAKVMIPEEPDATLFDMAEQPLTDDIETKPDCIEVKPEDIGRFERLDRMKGAIFGYCLGFYYSLPKAGEIRDDYVEYLGVVDNLVNSVTQANAEELETYRCTLEYVLYRFGMKAMSAKAKPIGRMKKTDVESFNLEEELRSLRRMAAIDLPAGDRNDSFALNMYRTDLEERIRKAKDDCTRATPFKAALKPFIDEGSSGPVLRLPERDGELAQALINHLIRADVLGKARRSLGYQFALECGKEIRNRVGDRWESSGEREYVNRLLPHLNNMEEFDPNDNPGIEDESSFEALRVLAMLCERQDNEELDSFYRYLLIKCQVADLCLPFALWGATFGFSAIPKTLCDSMSKATEDTARELFGAVLASLEK
ncbi:MAG: hypothetical protein Q4A93_03190 [Actinomycetota bacterium]|nr:hypothetical protein [Actinomycetota bacterium]